MAGIGDVTGARPCAECPFLSVAEGVSAAEDLDATLYCSIDNGT